MRITQATSMMGCSGHILGFPGSLAEVLSSLVLQLKSGSGLVTTGSLLRERFGMRSWWGQSSHPDQLLGGGAGFWCLSSRK